MEKKYRTIHYEQQSKFMFRIHSLRISQKKFPCINKFTEKLLFIANMNTCNIKHIPKLIQLTERSWKHFLFPQF